MGNKYIHYIYFQFPYFCVHSTSFEIRLTLTRRHFLAATNLSWPTAYLFILKFLAFNIFCYRNVSFTYRQHLV